MKDNEKANTHDEVIQCPECGKRQIATVLLTVPFATYIHHCLECEYIITESDWTKLIELK